ncbi:MAG: hypothetical protein M1834_000803 [Cirrosporium novae-zelandiae]|nr:MAG: hypothetical protein M1834_000803 [Cirrosporium novae-zelandiae]
MDKSTTVDVKPHIVFVPGAWHLPYAFDTVRKLLAEDGYLSEVPAFPSVGAEPPTKTLNDDIHHVHEVLERLANQGKKIIVVVHSYGGLVGASAVKGLELSQRVKQGKDGSVIMLVYMSAFVVPKGSSLKDMLGGKWLPWMKFNGDYCWSSEPETAFYSDLAPYEQKKWISKLTYTSASVFSDPVTYEPWHSLPCMYLFCEKDQGLPISVQRSFAATLKKGCHYNEFSCQGSHSSFLSMPEKVVEAVRKALLIGINASTEMRAPNVHHAVIIPALSWEEEGLSAV